MTLSTSPVLEPLSAFPLEGQYYLSSRICVAYLQSIDPNQLSWCQMVFPTLDFSPLRAYGYLSLWQECLVPPIQLNCQTMTAPRCNARMWWDPTFAYPKHSHNRTSTLMLLAIKTNISNPATDFMPSAESITYPHQLAGEVKCMSAAYWWPRSFFSKGERDLAALVS